MPVLNTRAPPEGQNVNVRNFLREGLHLPRGVSRDEFVIDSHVQDLLERGELAIHRGWRDKLGFASFLELLRACGHKILNRALRDLVEEFALEPLQKGLETVFMEIDSVLSQWCFDPGEERFHILLKRWRRFVGPQPIPPLQ